MSEEKHIQTDGGAYVGGNVSVDGGGDFVGGDQIIGRDKVTTSGPSGDQIAALFEALHAAVERRPDTSPDDKGDLKANLQELQAEAAKGDEADEGFVARRLRNIGRMAPDILAVVKSTLSNPASGLAEVMKKIAAKAA